MSWTIGSSGLLERDAARIVAFSPDETQILLVQGHDVDEPDRTWWFTPGGGIEADESPRDAAVREFFEETGLRIDPVRLIGPVIHREAVFHFAHHDRKQFEHFYTVVLTGAEMAATAQWNTGHLTEFEKDVLDDLTWWHLTDLASHEASGGEVYPRGLGQSASLWGRNWNGTVAQIFEL